MTGKSYQNNYAFIDSQNLNLSIRDQGWKLDYRRFRIYLEEKHKITKAFLFIGYIKENEKMYSDLKKDGFEIIFKRVSIHNGKIKGNVDAELVLNCVINIKNFDQAIIVTGDGDFYCLIDYLMSQNKFGKLLIPNKYKYSMLLNKYISKTVFVSDLESKLKVRIV